MTDHLPKAPLPERVDEVRAWSASRIAECRRLELKFGLAWGDAHAEGRFQDGPPQAMVEAWSERRALEAVIRILDGIEAAS